MTLRCGPCGEEIREDVREIIGHAESCEKRDPWGAFFRAPDKKEARRILIDYCGLKPPPPMPEHVKAILRERASDPGAQAVRKAKKRANERIRESIAAATRALIRKRGV